jgi:hypothetical protein
MTPLVAAPPSLSSYVIQVVLHALLHFFTLALRIPLLHHCLSLSIFPRWGILYTLAFPDIRGGWTNGLAFLFFSVIIIITNSGHVSEEVGCVRDWDASCYSA